MSLRLHAQPGISYANGPGRRLVLWLQGCTLGCAGCFNPSTHSKTPYLDFSIQDFRSWLEENPVDGLSISGGEPLQQSSQLLPFLMAAQSEYHLSIIMFTGYTLEEIQLQPEMAAVAANVDVLIAGRFDEKQPSTHPMLGSANQTIHFLTTVYEPEDLVKVPDAEVNIAQDGSIQWSGVHVPS